MLRFISKENRMRWISIVVLGCFFCPDLAFAIPPKSLPEGSAWLDSDVTSPPGNTSISHDTPSSQHTSGGSPPSTSDSVSGQGGGRRPRGHGGGDKWWIPVAIFAAAAAATGIAAWLHTKSKTVPADLKRDGPILPDKFKMSGMAMVGLVRGNWPMVIEFEQGLAGEVQLYVNARGAEEIFSLPLSINQMGRRLIVLTLPPELGPEPQPAVIATDGTSKKALTPLQVYAIGAGPRAVGSVSIDQIEFGPDGIHVSKGEKALYRFYSHSDFDNLMVEPVRVDRNSMEGDRCLADMLMIPGGVRRNSWIGKFPDGRREWNGCDLNNHVSPGDHMLRIRAWHQQGDWVAAWSQSMVTVFP